MKRSFLRIWLLGGSPLAISALLLGGCVTDGVLPPGVRSPFGGDVPNSAPNVAPIANTPLSAADRAHECDGLYLHKPFTVNGHQSNVVGRPDDDNVVPVHYIGGKYYNLKCSEIPKTPEEMRDHPDLRPLMSEPERYWKEDAQHFGTTADPKHCRLRIPTVYMALFGLPREHYGKTVLNVVRRKGAQITPLAQGESPFASRPYKPILPQGRTDLLHGTNFMSNVAWSGTCLNGVASGNGQITFDYHTYGMVREGGSSAAEISDARYTVTCFTVNGECRGKTNFRVSGTYSHYNDDFRERGGSDNVARYTGETEYQTYVVNDEIVSESDFKREFSGKGDKR